MLYRKNSKQDRVKKVIEYIHRLFPTATIVAGQKVIIEKIERERGYSKGINNDCLNRTNNRQILYPRSLEILTQDSFCR